MWTLAGVTVVGFLIFSDFTRNEYMFLFIYMAFWVYFEFRVLSVYRWRTGGIEKINIRPDEIEILREVKGRGIPQVYYRENIQDFGEFEDESKGKKTSASASYWTIAQPSFAFEYLGRTVTFGFRLEDRQRKKLFKLIDRFLTNHSVPSSN